MTSTSKATIYAVYLSEAEDRKEAGTVINRIMWDGSSSWSPPAGTALISDPDGKYPIGSVYEATAS